jgi:hypothetical protein
LLETEKYNLLNSLDLVEGGPWTWVSRANPKVKSCLDLGIISRNLLPFVHKVVVDVDRKFTPFRVMKRKTGLVSCYSDHFSFKVVFSGMPSAKNVQNDKEAIWNLHKQGGWEVYAKKTKEVADKIEEIVNNQGDNIEEVMQKVQKIENKVKFSAFGKTRKLGSNRKLSDEKK